MSFKSYIQKYLLHNAHEYQEYTKQDHGEIYDLIEIANLIKEEKPCNAPGKHCNYSCANKRNSAGIDVAINNMSDYGI